MDLVIFDIDGTLIHTHDEEARCFETALRDVSGISNISKDLCSYTHVTDKGIINELFNHHFQREATLEEHQAIEDAFITLFEKNLSHIPPKPIPGVRGIFNELSEDKDIALAIATGCYFRSALLKFKHANLPFRQWLISSSNDSAIRVNILKNAFEKAKKMYEVNEFETITYIGDGPWDIDAVNQLDWNFIGISSNFSEEYLRKRGANRIIQDYACSDTFFSHLK